MKRERTFNRVRPPRHQGQALGVPVHELFGGALRDRIPAYWSRCGVIRARCASFFDGNVIEAPAVRSLADLKAAGREACESMWPRTISAVRCRR
jgi:L-alanine-DL-glutamate epimerase-like enolase superfamily enzyme